GCCPGRGETSPTRCGCRGGPMRPAAWCSIAVAVLVAFPAVAAFDVSSPTQGAEPPGQSFSQQDDATSLAGNPAGLGFLSGFDADFLHNGFYGGNVESDANALHLAGGGGGLTLGLGFDWLNRPFNADGTAYSYRRTSLAGALRGGGFSLGVAYRWLTGLDIHTWDFGLLSRPVRWLSLGAAALDATRPPGVPRRWVVSAAVRPFQEKLDLATDLRWNECTNAPASLGCGLDHAQLFFTAQGRVLRGLTVIGQLGVPIEGGNVTGLVGLQVDFGHVGVAYGPTFMSDVTQDSWRVRVSSDRWPSIGVPVGHGVDLDLRRALSRPRADVVSLVFGATAKDPLALTLATFRRIAADGGVKVVVLRSGGLPLGLARAEELRAGIEDLKASGKKVLFYLESGGDLEYSVALSADRIYAAPQAVLLVNGFAASALFAAAGLDKLGVKAEFFRVGAYKNAP